MSYAQTISLVLKKKEQLLSHDFHLPLYVRLSFNVTMLWCFIIRYVGRIKIESLYHIAIHYKNIEYWLMFEVLNIGIYPQTGVPQQCLCVLLMITHILLLDYGSQPKHIYHQPLLKSGLTWYLKDDEAI